MTPLPIKWRIVIGVVALLVASIATISVVAYREQKESLISHLDATLRGLAAGVGSELAGKEEAKAVLPYVRSTLGTGAGHRSTQYRIWREGPSEEVLATSDEAALGLWRQASGSPNEPPSGKMVFFDVGQDGDEYRAVWSRSPIANGVASTFIAVSSRYAHHEMQEFLKFLLILGSSIAIGTGLLTGLVVFWAMRPIGATAKRLKLVTHKNLAAAHLDAPQLPSELVPFREALREMLRRLDQAMQQQKRFTADASHELRTPLALAKSTLQAALVNEPRAQGHRQAITEALDDVARMEHLLDQLLTLARMDESQELPEMEEVSLDKLLAEVAGTYDERACRHGGRAVCEPMPHTLVRGSTVHLGQLFGNLLDNAIRHGPPGGAVRVALGHQDDGWCTAVIHDDGGSIPPEHLSKLFDRFYRLDNSRARATGGTGLGLSISQEIARRHGGRIEIVSNRQAGTNVSVHLPRIAT